jgi:hypothetical protein
LKAAEGDHPHLADDDPQAVKLMVDYLYLDDYDPRTLPPANPIPPVGDITGVDSTIARAVEVTQADPPPQDPWLSSRSTGAFGAAPSVTAEGPSTTSFGTARHATPFGTSPSATPFDFGAVDPPPQPDDDDMWAIHALRKKDKMKAKKKAILAAEPPPDSFLEMHAKMFAIASKYGIKSLERTAREKFKDQFDGDWSAADLIAAIEIVFNHTPEGEIELRNALKDAIVQHAAYLVQKPGFGEAVANIDGLVYDLFCRKTYAHA